MEEEKKCVWCKKPFKYDTPETHFCLVKKRVDDFEKSKREKGKVQSKTVN